MGSHFVGDIGKPIRSYNNTDLSQAVGIAYRIRKPSGNLLEPPCSIIDQTNGVTEYITQSGDIDEVGLYSIQTVITYGNGRVLSSDPQVFRIEPRV